MNNYIVTFKLESPLKKYKKLIEVLNNMPASNDFMKSFWIVKTDKSAEELRDYLGEFTKTCDSIFVSGLTDECAWRNIDQNDSSWLMKNF